jgi:ABC-2 type transport system ATP-binding protein
MLASSGRAGAKEGTSMSIIEVSQLTKSYDNKVVVDGVSFGVEEGEIFAIVGPNGAGKSTTVESIAGLRTPDSGRIEVFGFDPIRDRTQVRELLGVQLQESRFQDRVKVREVVETFAALYPDPVDVSELLERLGLDDKAGTRYSKLSGGQQQRLSIAVALVGRPRAVILDELTTGLDPQARRETWGLVEELRDGGATVLLVTHFMEEAERLADRLAVIDQGRLVALDTPRGVIDDVGLDQRIRFTTPEPIDDEWLRSLPGVTDVSRSSGEIVVTGNERLQFSVVSLLASRGIVPGRFQVDRITLDDAFVAIAGRSLTTADEQDA